ncbi:hypothetical protein PENSPDRAFT_673775 [Peniophora sp. CONT]|nr:hypothetical protein PENSPDRAFT_673775 [Peniophora sp. CONT]
MDSPAPSHARVASASRSRTRTRGKSPARAVARKEFIAGIGLLLCVVFLWTGSNFVTQDLFDGGYNKPFLVTYLTTSSFSVYLVVFGLRRLWRKHTGARNGAKDGSQTEYEPLVTEDPEDRPSSPYEQTVHAPHELHLPPLTTAETAKLAIAFCAPWFLANWSLNAGLMHTSVASATILSSMSGFFTLILGTLAGVDRVSLAKLVAVGMSFGGVVLVSLSDSSSPATSTVQDGDQPSRRYILGDALALLSSLLYALYVILLKVKIRSESRVDMQLFFGFVGAFNIVAVWPLGVILHFAGVEPFELPQNSRAVGGLLINMAITLSSDFIYVLAMLKTSPLVVTIGLSLTMPLAVIGDMLLGRAARAQVVIGAALVLAAFGVIGVAEDKEKEREAVVIVQDLESDLEPSRLSGEIRRSGSVTPQVRVDVVEETFSR